MLFVLGLFLFSTALGLLKLFLWLIMIQLLNNTLYIVLAFDLSHIDLISSIQYESNLLDNNDVNLL